MATGQAEREHNQRYLTYLGSDWGGMRVDLSLVPPESTVISAGLAHDISFDVELIDRRNCYIVGIDPTWMAYKTVMKYKLKNLRKFNRFEILRKALGDKTGLTVRLGGPARTSLSPVGEKAKTLAFNDLLSMYPGTSLIKIDIEGAEFPVIESIAKLRVPQFSVGFHIWLNNASDLFPNEGVVASLYTKQDVLDCVKKIKGLGYKLVYEWREHEERIGQEALFIRKDFASGYQDIELD